MNEVEKPTWYADDTTYSFKTVYTLKMSDLKLIILYDKKVEQVVSGTAIIYTDEYMEFDFHGLTIEEAQHALVLKAINIGSSVLLKKERSDPDLYNGLLDNLAELYIMETGHARRTKEEFRARYLKGEEL